MRVNESDIAPSTVEHDDTAFRRTKLAAAAGGDRLGCSLYELPPGKKSWPFHYHTGNEAALYVLAGTGRLRTPEGRSSPATTRPSRPARRAHTA